MSHLFFASYLIAESQTLQYVLKKKCPNSAFWSGDELNGTGRDTVEVALRIHDRGKWTCHIQSLRSPPARADCGFRSHSRMRRILHEALAPVTRCEETRLLVRAIRMMLGSVNLSRVLPRCPSRKKGQTCVPVFPWSWVTATTASFSIIVCWFFRFLFFFFVWKAEM